MLITTEYLKEII